MIQRLVLALIRAYQRFFSRDHSIYHKWKYPLGFCPFYPSCSEYTYQVIQKRGLFVGVLKSIWRITRCHPWAKGGQDLP